MKTFLRALAVLVLFFATTVGAVDVQHSTLTGANIHQPFHYEQTADPGAVGANKWWYKTDTKQLYRRNAANTAWDLVVTVPGANTQVVFNDAGSPGADAGLTYNKTTDVLTVSGGVVANLTGNATTATALAANGTNCPAGQAAAGVDASGNAESCFTPVGEPGGGIVSINGLNPTAQTIAGGTNINVSSVGSTHTIGVTGQVAIANGGTGAATAADARTNLDVQQKDTDLQALADNVGNGLWARTGAGTGATRTVQPTTDQTTVTNGGGIAGDPTIGLATKIIDGSSHYAADGGASDDYAITVSPAPTAYITGAWYRFKPNTANIGPATLAVNGLPAKAIKKLSAGSYVDLETGDICVGNNQEYEVAYDSVNFLMQSPTCTGGGGGGTPGGANTQVQFNNAGAFGGDAGMTYNSATDVLTVNGGVVSGNCATNCLTIDTSAITGAKTQTVQNVADTFVYRTTTDTLTNKTLSSSTNVVGGVTMTLGSDATGDVYYRNSSGVLTRLGVGSNGNVLTLASGLPSWAAPVDIGARVHHSVAQTIADITETVLAFDTEDHDTNNMHDTVTNNSRITINTAGKYSCWAGVEFAINATGVRELFLKLNGIDYIGGSRGPGLSGIATALQVTSGTISLAATDYVQVVVKQNSGGNLDISAPYSKNAPHFSCQKVG